MAKIYTRGGDSGETSFISGQRVSKGHELIEAYGTVDELNSAMGLARAILSKEQQSIDESLRVIQNQLFVLGSHLACDDESSRASLPALNANQVQWLENLIDQFQETLPELKDFILPGGSAAAAALHSARSCCRRAERLIVRLNQKSEHMALSAQYLNRLSDTLFVLARAANQLAGREDEKWSK